jgi:thioredoxin 1
MSQAIITVDEQNFQAEVKDAAVPVLVDFWAPWCVPCKMIAPILEEVAAEYGPRAKVAKVNVDENRKLVEQFGIRGIPALFIFKGGQVVAQLIGNQPKSKIVEALDKTV